MSTKPYLIPCLVQLRSEFNTEAPNRDKGADGWIGDPAHQTHVSDHNPDSQGRVLAIDIDTTGPWPNGYTLDTYVNYIIERCRSGEEDRIEYIIRNRKIFERDNDYNAREYDGDDPHTNHAHFSARHDHTGQNSKGEWFMLSATDKTWITDLITHALAKNSVAVGDDHWGADTAVGYSARKSFEIQRDMPSADEIAAAVVVAISK